MGKSSRGKSRDFSRYALMAVEDGISSLWPVARTEIQTINCLYNLSHRLQLTVKYKAELGVQLADRACSYLMQHFNTLRFQLAVKRGRHGQTARGVMHNTVLLPYINRMSDSQWLTDPNQTVDALSGTPQLHLPCCLH